METYKHKDNEYRIDGDWLFDEDGNRCSKAFFGSFELAAEALSSLIYCKKCVNCSDCYRCYDCSDCYRCSHCSDCSRCYDCSDCSHCSDCYRCYDCSDCSRCYDCSDCSHCSHCSECSRCYDCYRCYGDKQKIETKSIIIPDIHKVILEAATETNHSLDMSDWHICETTHCRAGWVVAISGEAGKDLEEKTSTEFAAMMIYKNSSKIKVSPAMFYTSKEASISDMQRCAKLEAEQ